MKDVYKIMEKHNVVFIEQDNKIDVYGFAQYYLFGIKIGQQKFTKLGKFVEKEHRITFIPAYNWVSFDVEKMYKVFHEMKFSLKK